MKIENARKTKGNGANGKEIMMRMKEEGGKGPEKVLKRPRFAAQVLPEHRLGDHESHGAGFGQDHLGLHLRLGLCSQHVPDACGAS